MRTLLDIGLHIGCLLSVAMQCSDTLAQFKVDMTPAEARRLNLTPAIIDMASGESGYVLFPLFCQEGGLLFVYGGTLLSRDAETFGFRFERISQSQVAVFGSAANDTPSQGFAQFAPFFAELRPCAAFEGVRADLLSVAAIDGANSVLVLHARQ